MRIHRAAAALMAVLVLSACAAPPPPEPSPTPTPKPVLELTLQDIPDGTVIGTGSFSGVGTETSGTIQITVEDGAAVASLVDLSVGITSPTELFFSPYSIRPDHTCFDDGWRLSVGTIGSGQSYNLGGMTEAQGDPGFLDTAVIAQMITDPTADCLGQIVGLASLTWTLPDMRPGLEVVDSGNRRGAEGSVELVDGVPATYTVVPSDEADAIAVRFGITVEELDYLNPTRARLSREPLVNIGEELNLDRTSR